MRASRRRAPGGRPSAAPPRTGALLLVASLAASLAPGAARAAEPEPPAPGVALLDVDEGAIDDDGQEPRIRAELVAERSVVYPDDPLRVGLRFELDPGWHLYWKNPGGGGAPTVVTWHAEGLELGATRWPAPSRFSEAGGLVVSFGYAGDALLFTEARLEGEPSQVELGATVDLLVCASECIPARFELGASLPVALGESAPPGPAPGAALFDGWTGQIPADPAELGVELEVALGVSAVRPGDRFEAAIGVVAPCAGDADCPPLGAPGDGAAAAFVPERLTGVTVEAVAVRPHPVAERGAVVVLRGRAGPDDPRGDQALSGVLRLAGLARPLSVEAALPRAPADAAVVAVASPLLGPPTPGADGAGAVDVTPGATTPAGTPAPATPLGLLQVLLLAFLGGLVLNLMPCVLPVLGIKAFALAQLAHARRSHVVGHVLAYTAGIVGSLLALAGVVVALRAAGTGLGWGFQLQEPVFVAVVSAVLVVFALNLFGVFEIGVGAGKLGDTVDRAEGLPRSFGEGVLAVVLATPCSAPFLGTAVGFAFASGAGVTFAVFTVLGLGLAAPFAALALVPGARRLMPRPGPWMDGVRRVLGFALLATVVWLAWVYGRVTGVDGIAAFLAFLLAVGLATFVATGAGLRPLRWGVAVAIVAVAGVLALRVEGAAPRAAAGGGPAADEDTGLVWATFDADAVRESVAAGHPVLVDFTADWCITCQVNEQLVLTDPRVVEALRRHGVRLYEADWTRRDEPIRRELAKHGKAGVPLYLVYAAGAPDAPRVLPELLTVDLVLEAIRAAAPEARAATADASAPSPG